MCFFLFATFTKYKELKLVIMSCFDYCLTLSIYYSIEAINKLTKMYYLSLFKLFRLNFLNCSLGKIEETLSEYNLHSFHHRLCFRSSVFVYKIMYGKQAPVLLKEWLKPVTPHNELQSLRSNIRVVFKGDRTRSKQGDRCF